jgi:hypothetical protein
MADPIPRTKSGSGAGIVFATAFGGLALGLALAKLLDVLRVPKNNTVITIGVLVYVVAVLASVGISATRGPRAQRRLQQNGVRGTGRLVSATQTSTRINNLPVVELVLDVEIPGRAPYRVRHLEVMGMESAHQLTPGTEHPVLIDRDDPLLLSVEL